MSSEVYHPVDDSFMSLLPQELFSVILSNLSSYQLAKAARVSKRFNALCDKIRIHKYQAEYYAVGLEYFAPGADILEKTSLVKFLKLKFDPYLVDKIFNDDPEEIVTPFPEDCDLLQNIPILKVALKHKKFKAPLTIDNHVVFAELFDGIYESGASVSLNWKTFQLYLKNSAHFDWPRVCSLMKRSSSHLEFYSQLEDLVESERITDQVITEVSDLKLLIMLRIASAEDWAKIDRLLRNYDMKDFVLNWCMSALRHNPDSEFVYQLVSSLRHRMDPAFLCSLSHQLLELDCGPKFYAWLFGFDLDEFEEENLQASIEKYGGCTSQSIHFVDTAIVLGKPDELVIRLIENLESFTCEVCNFFTTPFIKGMSKPVAKAMLSRESSSHDWNDPAVTWNNFEERIRDNVEALGTDIIMEWLVKSAQSKGCSVHSYLFIQVYLLTSARQIGLLLDKIIEGGGYDADFIMNTMQNFIVFYMDDNVAYFLFHSIFKARISVPFPSRRFRNRILSSQIAFDTTLLDEYIAAMEEVAPNCDSVKLARAWRNPEN